MTEQNHHTCQAIADGFFSLPLSLVFFPHPVFSRSPLWGGYSCPVSLTVDRRNFSALQAACHDVTNVVTRSEAEQMVWTERPTAAPLSSPDKRGQATSEPSSFKKHLKALYHPSNSIPWSPKTEPVAACILLYNRGKTHPLNHNSPLSRLFLYLTQWWVLWYF